ncbi:MAG TPA: hypothetical protein DD473_16235 [Planctomycetaceae bacterium]|nr:hypothetical protein [Planctomycetaceae bacterium]|tara:strand:- start:524 stop:1159 length:636 start_codon:yes stop_codon:yes gene_type:complete
MAEELYAPQELVTEDHGTPRISLLIELKMASIPAHKLTSLEFLGDHCEVLDPEKTKQLEEVIPQWMIESTMLTELGLAVSFQSGGEIAFRVPQLDNKASIERRSIGHQILLTPEKIIENQIVLKLSHDHSEVNFDKMRKLNGYDYPGIDTRRLMAAFKITPGETILVTSPERNQPLDPKEKATSLDPLAETVVILVTIKKTDFCPRETINE